MKNGEITTFLVSDLKLFDAVAARAMEMSIEEYNTFAIYNINYRASEQSFVILNGAISVGSLISTLSLLSQIKAKIIILAEDKVCPFCTQEDLKKWRKNASFVWTLDGYCPITVLGEEKRLIIPTSKKRFLTALEEKGLFYAAPASMFPEGWSPNDVYDFNHRVLNTSYDMWHYEPIDINELGLAIDDYEVFNTMKTAERKWEEGR